MGIALGIVAKWLADQFANPSPAGSGGESVSVALANIAGVLTDFIEGVGQLIDNIDGAWVASKQDADLIGKALISITANTNLTIDHIVGVILPNTCRNVVGYVYSNGIVPLRVAVKQVADAVTDLQGRVKTLEDWRKNTADPELARALNWETNFDHSDRPSLNVLEDWLSVNADFVDWAVPLLARPLYDHLADPAHQVLRDQWALLFSGAWQDLPELTAGAMEAWLNAPGG